MRCPICLMGRWLAPVFAIVLFVMAGTVMQTTGGALAAVVIAVGLLALSWLTWRMPDHSL